MGTADTTQLNDHSNDHDLDVIMERVQSCLVNGRYIMIDCFNNDVTTFHTTRLGGESKPPYDSFNLALHVGDDAEQVLKNRELLRNDFGFERVLYMNQTHSNVVTIVDENNALADNFDCDGLVTKLRGVGLAVMTADCLPLLLCDEQNDVVAAVHCGWRGIERGIINNALTAMESLGSKRSSISAYMGPAIGPDSFEVGHEVRDAFLAQDKANDVAFVEKVGVTSEDGFPKYNCNIYTLTINALKAAKVEAPVFGSQKDTCMRAPVYYSYRKSKVTGRMATVICLNKQAK